MSTYEILYGQRWRELCQAEGHVRRLPTSPVTGLSASERRSRGMLAGRVLKAMDKLPRDQSAAQIGEAMGMTRQSIAPTLLSLHRAGLVTRVRPVSYGSITYSLPK